MLLTHSRIAAGGEVDRQDCVAAEKFAPGLTGPVGAVTDVAAGFSGHRLEGVARTAIR